MMVNLSLLAFAASVYMSLIAASTNGPNSTAESLLATSVQESLMASTDFFWTEVELEPSSVIEKRDLLPSLLTQIVPTKTHTTPEKASPRSSFKRIKIHGYLLETLNAILPHTATVRNLCAGADRPQVKVDAEKLGWALGTELREILRIVTDCLSKVKTCGTAPSPSGIPGGKTPTLDDIFQLSYKIMCEIRECCKLISSLCNKYKAIRRVCEDTLKQINSCMASIAVRCGIEVGDLSAGLKRLFDASPEFFVLTDFDFGLFPGILANGHGALNLNLNLSL